MERSRYADTWGDTITSVAKVRAQGRRERRCRRMLALTDGLLGRLEVRNLKGECGLDERLRGDIAQTLGQLDAEVRARFPTADTVQEAIDGTFEMQGQLLRRLQRLVHWEGVAWDEELQPKTA